MAIAGSSPAVSPFTYRYGGGSGICQEDFRIPLGKEIDDLDPSLLNLLALALGNLPVSVTLDGCDNRCIYSPDLGQFRRGGIKRFFRGVKALQKPAKCHIPHQGNRFQGKPEKMFHNWPLNAIKRDRPPGQSPLFGVSFASFQLHPVPPVDGVDTFHHERRRRILPGLHNHHCAQYLVRQFPYRGKIK